ncbi:MAG TPA: Asp-tRNA(Asn)/Glu-tRNA(Gln) amidotransferase subunit GatB [Candidatus Levybacteria bacterium]|nr:Asp-tRNA(Asn)/Glu-tRNA(Gln) amidotransferase subunit GatB [Candidatus Levybacteria bacterium]
MNNEPSTINNYTLVIGLEVHVELKTKTKMFCGCAANYFGEKPNTHTCPVCLGLPGALPYPNKTAIDWCIKIALALNCLINQFSKFDRKNYFYPDLSKGYQISQYDLPFGYDGFIEVTKEEGSSETKKIKITRVHMEEDTGKLSHAVVNGEKVSLVDFNRSGVPLVEIVTEPDFENEHQVIAYLQKLQKIVRYLNVSNADMEKGEMRLEPNISLRMKGENGLPNYKVEVKNINSFRFVDRAIKYEAKRQKELLEKGERPAQETRGWNETKNATISQRSKEEAHDYRYFPEPDIPPITTTIERIAELLHSIGELPDEKQARFEKVYELPQADAEILTRDKITADFFDRAVKDGEGKILPKEIANAIINKKLDITKFEPSEVVKMVLEGKKKDNVSPDVLASLITNVLSENPQAVEDYKSGKENAIMFLLGQVLRKAGKKLDATAVKNGILEALK